MEEDFTMLKDALSSSIDELCVGQPENRFDAWCKKKTLSGFGCDEPDGIET